MLKRTRTAGSYRGRPIWSRPLSSRDKQLGFLPKPSDSGDAPAAEIGKIPRISDVGTGSGVPSSKHSSDDEGWTACAHFEAVMAVPGVDPRAASIAATERTGVEPTSADNARAELILSPAVM